MEIYKFYSIRNLAETWRDPDELVYGDEFYSTSKHTMEQYVLKFLKDNYPNLELPKEIELDTEDKWHFDIFGSWMPTYYIEKIEVLEDE